jgi:hypothetical protein
MTDFRCKLILSQRAKQIQTRRSVALKMIVVLIQHQRCGTIRDRLTFRDWRPAAGSGEMFDAIAQPARRHEDWLNLSADF